MTASIFIATLLVVALVELRRLRAEMSRIFTAILQRSPFVSLYLRDRMLRQFWERWRHEALVLKRLSPSEELAGQELAPVLFEGHSLAECANALKASLIKASEEATITILRKKDDSYEVLTSTLRTAERLARTFTDGKEENAPLRAIGASRSFFSFEFEQTHTLEGLLVHIGWNALPTEETKKKVETTIAAALPVLAQYATLERERQLRQDEAHCLASISHDLRHPTQCALAIIQELNAHGSTSAHHDTLEGLLREQLRILENYIDLQRENVGTLSVRQREVGLTELFESIRSSRSFLGYKTSLTVQAPPPRAIYVDRGHMERILSNLVLNGLKHSSATRIVLSAKEDVNGNLRISVIDDGIGLSSSLETKLFQPNTSSSLSGSGLGLSLCRVLAERNGCELGYQRVPSGGSEFFMNVPPGLIIREPEQKQGRLSSLPEQSTILIAEDDDSTARMIIRTTRAMGFHPVRVRSKREAMSYLLTSNQIQYLCTDLTLADGDLTEELIQSTLNGTLPPTLITSGREPSELNLDHLPRLQKPFSPEQLRDELHSLIQIATLAKANTDLATITVQETPLFR